MSTEDNKALIRRFNEEVFNKRNLAAIDEFITPDQVDHSLPSSLPHTREGTKQAIALTLQAFPDLNYQVEDMIAAGDKVVIRYTTIGTQRGPFGPIPPTRKRVAVSGIVITRIADGKIVEQWGVDDRLAMLQQLGLIPILFSFMFLAGLGTGMGLIVLLRKLLK
jgi:predicted ester cyclase